MNGRRLAPPDIEYSSKLSQVAYLLLEEGKRKEAANPFAFRQNDFTGCMELNGSEVTECDMINAAMELELRFRWRKYPPSLSKVWDAARWVAAQRPYHPVRDYLRSLSWDGVARVDDLLERYAGAYVDDHNRNLRQTQSRAILLGAIARIFRPGCKLDTMPVLIGGQGCGKSTFVRILATRSEYYSDTPQRLDSKDAYQSLSGVWLYEVAEMRSLQGSSAEATKAFLTSQSDRYRPPYGRVFVTRPRQVMFIGTSNDLELYDRTGARRYWPIPVGRPNLEALRADVHQLWAEAYAVFQSGDHPWHIVDDTLVSQLKTEAERYTSQDPWSDALVEYAKSVDAFTVGDFLRHIGVPESSQTHKNVLRVARICRSLGMESGRSRSNGKRSRIWRFR
jgi:putative DNA primase/helicase